MSYTPPQGPGRDRVVHGLEPETEIDLGLGSSTSGASEIASAIGAAGMWSPDALLIEHRSLWGEIWRRFRRDKFAMVGVVIIILLVLVAVLAPWIAPHDPTKQYDEGLTMQGMPVGPSSQFWLGTDTLGRDLLSRLMYGARVSLVVGVLANGFALVLGVIFGLTAGYFRGGVETLLMRMTDVMMAFPIILLAVALVSVLKPSIWILILVIGIVYWTPMTRVIHGEVLSIREKEFVDAARLT
ncbi:MAG TPA: ABC transporter permease, partial [Thermoleophilia bacterium]